MPTVSVSALTFRKLKFSLSLPCAAASPSTHSLPLLQSIVTAVRYKSTQGQIPHHRRWCLPLWHSPRLTLSLSLSSGFLCFLLLSSPAVARASASTHTYRRRRCLSSASQPLVAAGPALLFFIFFLFYFFFSIFICLLDKTETPLTLILFQSFFHSLLVLVICLHQPCVALELVDMVS